MRNFGSLTPAIITSFKEPEELFTKDDIDSEWHALVKIWHPDRNHDNIAEVVFKHLVWLHKLALEKRDKGMWAEPHTLSLTTIQGRSRVFHKLPYLKKHTFELGTFYIAPTEVIYVVYKNNADLFRRAKSVIGKFKYANDKMKTEVSKYLPEVQQYLETDDHLVVIYKKTEDLVLLRDVFTHYGEKLHPRHVAWILSTLYNLACYLQYAELTHNDIDLDTYYISPQYHSGALLGGWWYATNTRGTMLALPTKLIKEVPEPILKQKKATATIDLTTIKNLGLELCGDRSGIYLFKDKEVPTALINWLMIPNASGDALGEYKKWQDVLTKAFGPRKFWKMDATANSIYKVPT